MLFRWYYRCINATVEYNLRESICGGSMVLALAQKGKVTMNRDEIIALE